MSQSSRKKSSTAPATAGRDDWAASALLLQDGAADLGQRLTSTIREKLLTFLQELLRWNSSYNLTAVRTPTEMVVKHVLDSLAILPHIQGETLLDVGSGAGVPGLVLAIVNPRLQVVSLDSNGKKATFQRHAMRALKLDNVRVVQTRIEAFDPTHTCPQGFDTVTARAFTSLPEFLSLCARLAAANGRLVAMLGQMPAVTDTQAPVGFTLRELAPLTVPGLHAERHVAIYERGLL